MEETVERTFQLFRWWLVVAAVITMAFGFALVLLPDTMGQLFGGLYLSDPLAIEGFGSEAGNYVQFVTAVLGAVMAGWGATLLGLLVFFFRPGHREAWWVITLSVIAWFVPDTAYSIWSGFWQNAVFNVLAFFLFAVPLAGTYTAMRKRRMPVESDVTESAL